jgi:hypothetical protein
MNSTRGSTPPNPNPGLPNRSTDLRKTLGIVGTPHGESIAKILSTKTCQIKRNRKNPAKKSSNPRAPKNPKIEPLNSWIWDGNQREKNLEGFTHTSPTKSPRARSRKHTKKTSERGLRKSPPRTTGNNTTKPSRTTPNHLYIPRRFIQGLACRPINQPSHNISP